LRLRLGWWGWIGGSMWASDKGLCRPTDIAVSRGNPSKAILVPRGYANERLGIGNRFVGLIRQRPNLAKRVEGIEQDNPTAFKIPNIPRDQSKLMNFSCSTNQ
jgi:hypothetical protein